MICLSSDKRVESATEAGAVVQTNFEQPPVSDFDQKRAALGYLQEAWAEAKLDGIDGDCLAQASLFTAFLEFVATYGEDAAARFAEGLSERIRNGEFTIERSCQ
jgi:hypothetical protein